MKRILTFAMLLAMMSLSSFAQEKRIKVINSLPVYSVRGLDMALGPDRYETDSLVIAAFPSSELAACFNLLRDCCEKGRLTGINMYNCNGLSEIPVHAFFPTMINGMPRKADSEDGKNPARTNLRYITLPSNIERIGESAFACTNLEAITIPYLTKSIGDGAFADCRYLKDVTFVGNGVKTDAGYGFSGLADGAVLHVAEGLAAGYRGKADWAAFGDVREHADLYKVLDITLDGSCTLEEAVRGQDMACVDSMRLSGPVTKADMAFLKPNVRYNRLKCLDLTDCLLDDGELYGCRLESLRMPRHMAKIYHGFLSGSAVDMLTVPESYEEIGYTAFQYYEWFADSTLVVPEGCRKISYAAFCHCQSLRTLILPSTLEVLEPISLGFSYSREWEGRNLDLYINRMTPPACSQRFEDMDDELDADEYAGPFGCQRENGESAGCLTRNMRLFVPVGAKKNYETAEHWNHFRTIIETPLLTGTPTGISGAVTAAGTPSAAGDGIYTVDGRLVTRDMSGKGLLRGLYIVRENGHARKVVLN